MRTNFFVGNVFASGTEGHIDAETLPDIIASHHGGEAFHCAFELYKESLRVEVDTGKVDKKGRKKFAYVPQSAEHTAPLSFNKYSGVARGTLGFAWFDFDSGEDGGELAFKDVKAFAEFFDSPKHFKYYYSGSKGFHVAIPMGYFDLKESQKLPAILNHVATTLKKTYKTLDTTVFNAQRKFRALGTKHPKTNLYKIEIYLNDFYDSTLDEIKTRAINRILTPLSEAPFVQPIPKMVELAASFESNLNDSISLKEWAKYQRTTGERAFNECDFLKWCRENPKEVNEPEWYAAASIVGRFEDGRAKFQAMSKGHPDYNATDADDKLDQALGSAGPRTCQGIQAIWGKCFNCIHFEKIKSPVVILEKEVIPTEATGFYHIDFSQGAPKRTPDYDGLIKAYKRDFNYFIDSTSEILYTWTGTHYEPTKEIIIKHWIEKIMLPAPTIRVVNELTNKIFRNCVISETEFKRKCHDGIKGKLNLRNGILHLKDGVFTPHDSREGFRYVLPYDYDPSATAPTFEKFLNDVTLGRDELKKTLLEFMGYVLHNGYEDHCFLWLAGSGRNGKSTFLKVLEELVGPANRSTVALAQFEKPNYLQGMDGKLLNISEESDTPKIAPEVLGNLKALSSGAGIHVDQKYQTPYTMTPTAKLCFAANKPPYLSGTEDAIRSRMIVVPFDLKLEDHGEDGTISKIDFTLLDKMKDEMSGILNLVLAALGDFVRRTPRKIHRSAISYQATNVILRDSDPFEEFCQDFLVKSDEWVVLEEMFLVFKDCFEVEYFTTNVFSRKLRNKFGTAIEVRRDWVRDSKTRGKNLVRGVKLNPHCTPEAEF